MWTDGSTDGFTDGHLRPALLGRLCRTVNLKIAKPKTNSFNWPHMASKCWVYRVLRQQVSKQISTDLWCSLWNL